MTRPSNKPKAIPLRERFRTEDKHFTPWLCEDENLADLSEALGIDLEFETREKKVGPYSLDILCKNRKDKSRVAIENQFGTADHAHLGQILTYGAGLDVATMIWIAEDFTDLHRKAIKWLNKNTPKEFSFFAVKAEAKKIYGHKPVIEWVDFSIVCKPDGHRIKKKRGKPTISEGALTPMKILRKRYWQGLEKHMENAGSKLTGQTPSHWQEQYFKIGRSDTGIVVRLHIRENKVRIEIKLFAKKSSKAFFNLLYKDKKAIEKEFGLDSGLDWQEFPKLGHSSIGVNLNNINFQDEEKWDKQYANIKFGIERFDKVFTHRILALDPSDWKPTAKK